MVQRWFAAKDASELEGLARNAWQSGTAEADREVWALRMALPVATDIGEVVIAATFPRPQRKFPSGCSIFFALVCCSLFPQESASCWPSI